MKACCKEFLKAQFGGDEGVAEEIYTEYRTGLGDLLGKLPVEVFRGDWAMVDRLAHTIKGNALAVGDNETAEEAIALRESAKREDTADARNRITRLQVLAGGL